MKKVTAILLATAIATLPACAWMLPEDPYAVGEEVDTLKVADGMDPVYADPSLAVPTLEDKADQIVPGGHKPPAHKDYQPN
jgi:hypothetical protein